MEGGVEERWLLELGGERGGQCGSHGCHLMIMKRERKDSRVRFVEDGTEEVFIGESVFNNEV